MKNIMLILLSILTLSQSFFLSIRPNNFHLSVSLSHYKKVVPSKLRMADQPTTQDSSDKKSAGPGQKKKLKDDVIQVFLFFTMQL